MNYQAAVVLVVIACTAMAKGDLVAHWTFDEGRGSSAQDSSGLGNHGTVFGSATWATGVSGTALQFDGFDDFVDCGSAPSLSPVQAITISAWYKPTVSFTGTGNDPIVDKGYVNHVPPYYQYHLGAVGDSYPHSTASFSFNLSTKGSPLGVANTPLGTWTLGTWYLLTGTYDGATLTIYIDGVPVQSAPLTGPMIDYGKPLLIGRFNNLNAFLPGLIDDVQIYDRALNCSEIAFLFGNPGQTVASRAPNDANADLTGDGVVNAADLAILLGQWGLCSGACSADFDCNGTVDASDLAVLLGGWTG